MTCTDLRAILRRGEAPSGPAVQAHLDDCAACAALVDDDAALATALGVEDEPTDEELSTLLTSVKHVVGAEVGPRAFVRSRPTPIRLALATAALVGVAGLVAVLTPRADLATMSRLRLIAAMTGYTALAFAAMQVALRPLSQPAATERTGRLLIVAGLALATGFALAPLASGASITDLGMGFGSMAMDCFGFGSMLALPLLGFGWALDRGGYFVGSRLLLLGAAGGLAGNLFLELHCDILLPAHLLAGHVTVVVALLAAGVALSLGRRGGTP